MLPTRTLLAIGAACAGLLAAASPAAAGTVTSDGTNVRFTDPGAEANDILISTGAEENTVGFSGENISAGSGCVENEGFGTISCPLAPGGSVALAMGAGDDAVNVLELGLSAGSLSGRLSVDLGDGNDQFKGGEGAESVQGGPGVDTLDGLLGDDRLDAGPGDDTLVGDRGADTLLGGDGNDKIDSDGYASAGEWAADTVDGGAGMDTLTAYDANGQEATRPPFTLTLDGAANDGRDGEGDNVVAVEKFDFGAAGTFVGDDAANDVTAPETGAAGNYDGRGGNDVLLAGDAHGDVVTGGAGDDQLTAGYGNDTITGGPGRDIINGDRAGRCNEMHCDLPGGALGDDSIDVRDGEADNVTCGIGTDTVTADAADTIADDCERVDRASGGGNPPGGGVKLSVRKVSLGQLAKRGLKVSATCSSACALTAKLIVPKATAKKLGLRGTRTLARASRRLTAAGTATLRPKPARKAGKRIRRQRKLTVTVRVTAKAAGGSSHASKRVTLRR